MDAIKKKMQAMKLEKDNALDRAAHMEQLAKDANVRAEKVCISNGQIVNYVNTEIHSIVSDYSSNFLSNSKLFNPKNCKTYGITVL